jgi:hypothetical protein
MIKAPPKLVIERNTLSYNKGYTKIHMETQKAQNSQSNPEPKEQYSKYLTSNYPRAIVTKTSWYWHKNRHVDQRYRKEDPEISFSSNSYLIIDKGVKTYIGKI